MTIIQITLPDQLAKEAEEAGLLSPESVEKLLRDRLQVRTKRPKHRTRRGTPNSEDRRLQ